jgi:acetylornithine deacetylase
VLGPVKMSVTQIQAGYQHNMVPDICEFVVDVRTNEHYLNTNALKIIKQHVDCEVRERSLRLNSSFIPESHPLVQIANELNIHCYGSPTTSDQAVIPYPSVKMGPGDSARSHTADEFIYPEEIRQGIEQYITILEKLRL